MPTRTQTTAFGRGHCVGIPVAFAFIQLVMAPIVDGAGSWDDRFFLPGVDGQIRTVVPTGGEVYVAGSFTALGNVQATNIARWNGSRWSAAWAGEW